MNVRFCFILVLMASALTTLGQYKPTVFGQNRVQYKEFDWLYYGTDNYDVHYYNQGEEYAKVTLDVLEEEFEAITDIIGYSPFAKTKIFVYNSKTDLLQSNIGVGSPIFTIAGETKFVKLQLEVAYPGNVIDFRKELKYRLAQTLLNDMMFGGSLADVFQSAYLLHLPEWFTEGAARYVAYGWNIEMDDYMRDYLGKRKIRKFARMEDEEAALVGQSIWNYIAVRYGQSNLSNILNLTRIIRDENTSIASSLGIGFEQFVYEWADYYGIPMEQLDESHVEPEKDARLVNKLNNDTKLTQVKISPDGTMLAYVQNFVGKYKILVRDLESGRERVIHKGGYYLIDQEVRYDLPLIDWINETQVGIVEAYYGVNSLVTYDMETRVKNRKSLIRFNQINSISFNDNGKLAVLSADVKGQTDLYLISMRRNAVRRLIKDEWDDLDAEFIPGTDAIVFSSNRVSDTLGLEPSKISETPDILNLFAYDLDTTSNRLFRLTNTLSNDIKPVPIDKDNIYYLSDLKGINNMYRFNFADTTFTQVTNFRTSLQAYDINQYTKDLSYLMLNKGKSKIYLDEAYDLEREVFTPPTLRHQVKQLEYLRERREASGLDDNQNEFEEEWDFLGADSVTTSDVAIEPGSNFEFILDDYQAAIDTTATKDTPEFVDLDNYQFGEYEATEDSEEIDSADGLSAELDNPLNFLFGDPVLNKQDSLVGDSVGIRTLVVEDPRSRRILADSTQQLTGDGNQGASASDASYRHPIGYQFNDYGDLDGDSTVQQTDSEFIDLENYEFGPADGGKAEVESFLTELYGTPDNFKFGQGNFEVDTTVVKTPSGNFIDTDDYQFEDEPEAGEEEDLFSFLSIYLKIQKEPTVTGPLPFETTFTVDKFVTSAVIDQWRGFGFLLETQMSDVLENHRFNGGALVITDFQSGDFFAEYRYLKNTIDLKVRYDRMVIFHEQNTERFRVGNFPQFADGVAQKYKKNTYTLGASLPVTASARFDLDGFLATTEFYNLNPTVLANNIAADDPVARDSRFTYLGSRASFVFDNTLSSGLNLFEGMRGKVMFEHFQNLQENQRSFSNINVDLRRYQKIHRELILAGKLYYGHSFGNRPKQYMLGGMDNWILSQTDNRDQIETPLSFSNYKDNTDVLFSEFVNLRGFDFNRFSGSNVLAFNAELRWPIIKYLTRGAIKSDFLRNLQFIGFYDIGSAWTGTSPFSEDNSVDTRTVTSAGASPFEAVIKTTRNPWLASYGWGVRTVLLGYYVRFDVAKPIEDYKVRGARYYLTLGYDF